MRMVRGASLMSPAKVVERPARGNRRQEIAWPPERRAPNLGAWD